MFNLVISARYCANGGKFYTSYGGKFQEKKKKKHRGSLLHPWGLHEVTFWGSEHKTEKYLLVALNFVQTC